MAVDGNENASGNSHDNEGYSHGENGDTTHSEGTQNDIPQTRNLALQETNTIDLKTNDDTNDVDDEDEVDLSCGIGKCRTTYFGKYFANLYVFAICIGISTLFTNMVRQIIQIQLNSIERQFNIENKKAGLFDTVSKATLLCSILFAGHFAKKINIPLMVGLAGTIQGLALVVPAILQFTDPYTLPELISADNSSNATGGNHQGNIYLCHPDDYDANDTNAQSNSTETNELAFIMLLVVQAVKGVTDACHAGFLPMLYMDDNILDKSKMGIFVGIQNVISELSNPLGKEINGILTEIPIDLKDTEMDPKDKRFVAAWWLAFLIFGIGTALFSFPLILFPRKLVTKRSQKKALEKAMITFAGGHVDEPTSGDLATQDGIRKPSILITNENSEERKLSVDIPEAQRKKSSSFTGDGTRRPSLFPPVDGPTERKVSFDNTVVFEQPIKEKKATMWDVAKDFPRAFLRLVKNPVFALLLVDVAIISVPLSGVAMFRSLYIAQEYNVPMSEVAFYSGITSAVGHITGTVVGSAISKRVNTRLGYIKILLFTHIFIVVVSPMYIVFGCGNEPVYGFSGDNGVSSFANNSCACTQDIKLLSCGDDGKNYLSPCFAGCEGVDGKYFTECSLVSNTTSENSLAPGLCSTDCHDNFLVYVILHGIQYFVESLGMIPRWLLVLRIVDPTDRGFASSMFRFSYTIMAIPAPNIFGSLIDNTCLIWDHNYCSLYDRDQIRYLMGGVDITVYSMIVITLLVMFIIYTWQEKQILKAEEEKQVEKLKEEESYNTRI